MLQIIIWLGSFYLVLKGLQLLQAGLSAPDGSGARTIGHLGAVAAIVAALAFVILGNEQAKVLSPGGPAAPFSSLFSSDDDAANAADAMAMEAIEGADEAANQAMSAADNAVAAMEKMATDVESQ